MPIDMSPPLTEIGDYEILAKIAEGGMGTVYKGRRRSDGLVVAIKIIPPTAARNPVLMQRFKREFDAAKQIDHPNVVKAIDYCSNVPTPFLVMEFVDGESLGQRIEREGKLPEAEAVRLMAQVCQGLHRAHKQNMIHRDVKPDNILITHEGAVAKLTDLGLVKDMEGEMNLTRTGRGLGTPHFMAPEQFRNAKNADVRCDVYSLGATLYMAVTGKMPFDGCGPLDAWMKKSNNDYLAPREIDSKISDRVDWAIRRAMSADPTLRPATCREFVEDVTGQSTRPAVPAAQSADLWYMVYKDEDGTIHTVKGTTENIRKAYREGLLGDAANIRAARTKTGPFQALHACPEFRDLVIAPEAPPAPPAPATQAVNNGPTMPFPSLAAQQQQRWTPPAAQFPTPVSGKFDAPKSAIVPMPPPPPAPGGMSPVVWIVLIALSAGIGTLAALFLPRLF
jgi:serine/threonine protein kinase